MQPRPLALIWVVGIVLWLLASVICVLLNRELEAMYLYFPTLTGPLVGALVTGVWLAQCLGRRWRPEAGWIDRLGRGLGFAWIVSFAIVWCLMFFPRYIPPSGPPPL